MATHRMPMASLMGCLTAVLVNFEPTSCKNGDLHRKTAAGGYKNIRVDS